jgi:predicted O-methyltransferase YrrM
MPIYQEFVNEQKNFLNFPDERRFAAQQLLRMHQEAKDKEKILILEFGVNKGQSTKIFLNAIDNKVDAKLISVDINDHSDVSSSKKWEFVQQDSSDVEKLLKKKPEIKKGIDIFYIDSLHTASHVKKEIFNYFKFLKKNSTIFFDDIDSHPYMKNQRKDSIGTEINNRKIFQLLEAIFYSNMDKIDFEILRGSTGLGIFTKRVEIGEDLREPNYIPERNSKIFNKLKNLLFLTIGGHGKN